MSTTLQQHQNKITNVSNPINANTLTLYFKNLITGKSGNFIETVNLLDNAVNAPSYSYYNIMANSYLQKNDFINAAISLQKSLEINPKQADVHYKLGLIHEIQGLEESGKYYTAAMQLDPNFSVIDNNLASMLVKSTRFFESFQNYVTENNINPDNPKYSELYFNLGRIFDIKGDFDSCITCFAIVIKHNPNNIKANYRLGFLYDIKGLLDESINCLLKTIELSPDYAEAYFLLGHKYFKKMEFLNSSLMYIKARELNPQYARPNTSLGNIYSNFN